MTDNKKEILIWSNVLGVLGLFSINIYLPSLPFLIHYFHTSPQNLKLSISLFLLGFAASQFFWGSLSERFGRKKPILWGLVLACIGTLITMLAPNVFLFNSGRMIEGIGIGCASSLTRALLTDTFEKKYLSTAVAYLTTSANIMPALAPIIGGYLLHWFGWRYIFLFLFFYALLLLYVFYRRLPETHKSIRTKLTLKEALIDYAHVLTHREFIGYLCPYILMSGGMFGYYAAAPFIFISVLHFSAQHYGFMQIGTVVSYIIGANICSYLSRRIGMNKAIMFGVAMGILATLLLIGCWLFSTLNIFTLLIPMTVFCFGCGIVSPNANAGAMATLSQKAGSSAAVISTSVYAASALFSAIITMQNLSVLTPLMIYIGIISLCAMIGFWYLVLLPAK